MSAREEHRSVEAPHAAGRRGRVCSGPTRRRAGAQPGTCSRRRSALRMVDAGVVRNLGRPRDHLRAGARDRRSGTLLRCHGKPGDKVVVPPSWAHCVINADPERRMVFGAFCDRQYGFVYDDVRAHGGLAWFPVLDANSEISWEANPKYRQALDLSVRSPRIVFRAWTQFQTCRCTSSSVADPDSLQWVSEPARVEEVWNRLRTLAAIPRPAPVAAPAAPATLRSSPDRTSAISTRSMNIMHGEEEEWRGGGFRGQHREDRRDQRIHDPERSKRRATAPARALAWERPRAM